MKILVIGGTGFIGPYVIRDLIARGHDVAVFHRGETQAAFPDSVQRIHGNRNEIATYRAEFEWLSPDVVVDFILADERQTRALMDTVRGSTGRVVAISSQDVYRAYEVLLRKTPGPLQELPITEESEVRTVLHPYNPEQLRVVQKAFSWFTEDYDKIPVERTVLNDATLPGTVLRLPMVYGPGDPLHRLFATVKRMDDGRPAILMQDDYAKFIPPRGYIENVAAAIALATVSEQAAGRIYNIAEEQYFSELDWAHRMGDATGWKGALIPLAADKLPSYLRVPFNSDQNWIVSSARIRDELGFADPIQLDVALSRTIEWERANPPAQVDSKQFDYAAEDAALQQFNAARA